MTKGLVRYYGNQDLHFITCSCYRRQAQLRTAKRRDLFLKILEETRRKYRFVVHGYVVMPEHFHLLVAEPEVGNPSVVMKVIKQRFARRMNRLRKLPASAQIALWDLLPTRFGRNASTISMCGPSANGSRSYATCNVILTCPHFRSPDHTDLLNRLSTLTNSLTCQFGFGYDALSRTTQLMRPIVIRF